jgi:hypothetical protein
MYTQADNGLYKGANALLKLEKEAEVTLKAAVKSDSEQVDELFRKVLELAIEQREVKNNIKTILIDHSIAQIHDPVAKDTLRKVQQDYPFFTDRLYKSTRKDPAEAGNGGEKSGLDFYFLEDELSVGQCDEMVDTFYSWMDPYTYLRGLYDIGALIIDTSVPNYLEGFLREARDCYALGQFNAVYSLCRTVIEIAAKNRYERLGLGKRDLVNSPDQQRNYGGYYIDQSTRGELRNRALEEYKAACEIVHGERMVSQKEAREMLKRTLSLVQDLCEAKR